jgi:hypothetical protein
VADHEIVGDVADGFEVEDDEIFGFLVQRRVDALGNLGA